MTNDTMLICVLVALSTEQHPNVIGVLKKKVYRYLQVCGALVQKSGETGEDGMGKTAGAGCGNIFSPHGKLSSYRKDFPFAFCMWLVDWGVCRSEHTSRR